jgi:PAS domain S-box-containing protein
LNGIFNPNDIPALLELRSPCHTNNNIIHVKSCIQQNKKQGNDTDMTQNDRTPPEKRGFFSDGQDTLFRAVFDRIQTGIIIVDPDTHAIVEANPIAEQILGLSRSELIHRSCHGFICPAKEGACPVTDQNMAISDEERIFINKKGDTIAVLKTVARADINGKEYLVESFVDISDRKKADDRKVALIGFMNESVLRIRRPLELTQMNMQLIADQVKTGEYEAEEIRMELQIQANNISQMIKNLDDLVRKVAEEREEEIPHEFREFLLGK